MHFPKTGLLCTKDNLARLIKKNQTIFGSVYDFIPTTYCLPNEYKQFLEQFMRGIESGKKDSIWICKPTDLSRGRGISVINNLDDLRYEQQSVIQEYIQPYLIRGTKWDLRVYVLIT
jgi:hypothetical protein